jgi:transposase
MRAGSDGILPSMEELHEHYGRLLGLDGSWEVETVDLSLEGRRVLIKVRHVGDRVVCPECGQECGRADHAPARQWRHLDTMQFETFLEARLPRARCAPCGVKTIVPPWAGKHSRFTLLFEAFAIRVLEASASVKQAATLLKLHWDAVHGIMERGVQRGVARRSLEGMAHVALDEKSFRKGQDYVSVMTDLDQSRVVEVVEGHAEKNVDALWQALPEPQRQGIRAVAMDMAGAYAASTVKHAPQAEIVHDKFHISKQLNEAVDKTRRAENKALQRVGDKRLKGTRQLWLYSPPNMTSAQRRRWKAIHKWGLKTARAWAIKDRFRWFWRHVYPVSAETFFHRWYAWAVRCRLTPMVGVARMLKRHLPRVLSYFRHRITSGAAEGFNSRIQAIKAAARGFRNFQHYRIRILFFCGKLNLLPDTGH